MSKSISITPESITFYKPQEARYACDLLEDGTIIVRWLDRQEPELVEIPVEAEERVISPPLYIEATEQEVIATGTTVARKRWAKPELVVPPDFNADDYLTYIEAAEVAGVSEKSICGWAQMKRFPIYRDPRSSRGRAVVRRSDLEAYVKAHRPKPKPRPRNGKKPVLAVRPGLMALRDMRPECKGCTYRTGLTCSKVANPAIAPVANDGDCIWLGVRPGDNPRPIAKEIGKCSCVGSTVRAGRCVKCGRKVEVEA